MIVTLGWTARLAGSSLLRSRHLDRSLVGGEGFTRKFRHEAQRHGAYAGDRSLNQ
jgi:hypothetical protein